MDADPWRCIRNHRRKTALRRTWSELDEPGSGSEMLYADLLCTGYDAVASATPLAAIKAGDTYDLAAMFIGKIPGTIGEVSVIALLIGAAYLLVKKVITIRIPAAYILSFAVFAFIFGQHNINYVLAEVCGGGLIFGAFFMATDYVTSPITAKGQIVFGICLGILTGLFRIFGSGAEGVSYAIIFCNMLVPLIEKVTLPTAFGKGGKKNGSK